VKKITSDIIARLKPSVDHTHTY